MAEPDIYRHPQLDPETGQIVTTKVVKPASKKKTQQEASTVEPETKAE